MISAYPHPGINTGLRLQTHSTSTYVYQCIHTHHLNYITETLEKRQSLVCDTCYTCLWQPRQPTKEPTGSQKGSQGVFSVLLPRSQSEEAQSSSLHRRCSPGVVVMVMHFLEKSIVERNLLTRCFLTSLSLSTPLLYARQHKASLSFYC